MTTAAFKIVGSNAVATFGIALTGSAVTLALSKLGHYSFDVPQDIKRTSSAAIRLFAFMAGAAAGFYVFQKTTVIQMDFDSTFISAHALSVLGSLYCATLLYLPYSDSFSLTVIYFHFAGLLVSIPCVALFGVEALLPAIGIGAGVSTYL